MNENTTIKGMIKELYIAAKRRGVESISINFYEDGSGVVREGLGKSKSDMFDFNDLKELAVKFEKCKGGE